MRKAWGVAKTAFADTKGKPIYEIVVHTYEYGSERRDEGDVRFFADEDDLQNIVRILSEITEAEEQAETE